MYPATIIFFGAVGFAALGWTAAHYVAPAIEGQLTAEAGTHLEAAGLPSEGVLVDGRTVWVSADLSGDASFERVQAVLGDMEGIREIRRRAGTVIESAAGEAAFVDVSWSDSTLQVRGAVREDASTQAIVSGLEERFPELAVTDSLLTDANVVSAFWEARLPEVASLVRRSVPSGGVSVRGLALVVRGTVPDENVRTELGERLTAELPGMRVINRIRTPSPAAPVADALGRLFGGRLIRFEPRSDVLTAESQSLLERVAVILEDNPSVTVRIEGFEANTAGPAESMAASTVKAGVVRDFLVRRGARPNSLEVRGMGTTEGSDDDLIENDAGRGAVRLVVDLE